jgi:hypothetical protein
LIGAVGFDLVAILSRRPISAPAGRRITAVRSAPGLCFLELLGQGQHLALPFGLIGMGGDPAEVVGPHLPSGSVHGRSLAVSSVRPDSVTDRP